MYAANSSAMLFGGGIPLDLGQKFFDKKPVFGKGKTFQGTLAGFFFGVITSLVIVNLWPQYTILIAKNYVLLGTLLSMGAIVGDLTASFVKRRIGIDQGKEWLLVDQLDFIAGGLIFSYWLFQPTYFEIILITLLTLLLHRFSNYLAFKAKLKSVPW